MVLATIVGIVAGFFRGFVDGVLARILDLIWAYPVVLLGIALGTSLALGGISIGPLQLQGNSLFVPAFIIGVVYIPYVAKPIRGQVLGLREQEFVDAARVRRRGAAADHVERDPAERRLDDHRLRPADDRQRDPAGGGAVVPRRRRAAAEPVVGDDDLRRHPPDPERDAPDVRARRDARARGARDQRLRRRRARRARPAREGAARGACGGGRGRDDALRRSAACSR